MSSLVFLNEFNESWLRGAGSYLDILNGLNKLTGSLKGICIDKAAPVMIEEAVIKATKL